MFKEWAERLGPKPLRATVMTNQHSQTRKVLLKLITIYILLLSSFYSDSQEINVGLNVGIVPIQNNNLYTIGGNLEYRPKNAIFSINTDPFVLFNKSNATFTEPIYLKFIIGKKLRICPAAGGFVRTIGNFGWMLGIHFEYVIKDKFILYSKNEIYRDFWKDKIYDHFGGTSTYINHSNSMLFSLGLKVMLKK